MAGEDDQQVAVRVAGQAVPLADLTALEELARTGQIGANSEVRVPRRGWVKASAVPQLARHFAGVDPWAAWEAMEDPEPGPVETNDAPAAAALGQPRQVLPVVAPDPDPVSGSFQRSSTGSPPAPRRGRDRKGPEELPDSALDLVEATLPPGAMDTDELLVETEEAPESLDELRQGPASAGTPRRVGGQAVVPPGHGARGDGPRDRGGKVIAFPRSPRPTVQGANALQAQPQVPVPLPAPRRRPPQQASAAPPAEASLRWGVPVAALVLGLSVVLGLRLYVKATAASTFEVPEVAGNPPGPRIPGEVAPAGAGADTTPQAGAAPGADRLDSSTEDELRGQMMEGILDVAAVGDLDDDLLIELRRVRVDVVSTSARVTSWTGRKEDAPEWADFRLLIRTSPERLERDLTGTALVVGKYVQHYSLQVETFEVHLEMEDGVRRLALDPELAAQLYLKRVTMDEFLRTAVKPAEAP